MSSGRNAYVLDSYALLALLEDEPGAERVSDVLADPAATKHMSVINLGEVLYILERRRSRKASQEVLAAFEDSEDIALVDVTRERAVAAASIKVKGGIAYADCFAVALAAELGATILTSDPEFKAVEGVVDVEWLPDHRGQAKRGDGETE